MSTIFFCIIGKNNILFIKVLVDYNHIGFFVVVNIYPGTDFDFTFIFMSVMTILWSLIPSSTDILSEELNQWCNG
jgi:hypothetical protein